MPGPTCFGDLFEVWIRGEEDGKPFLGVGAVPDALLQQFEPRRREAAALRDDPATEVIRLVSKPPARSVAERVLALAGETPLVAALVGLDADLPVPEGVCLADTLEGGVVRTLEHLGVTPPDRTRRHGPYLTSLIAGLPPERTTVRGLYSGGTLCYEALVLLGRVLGPVWSNTPITSLAVSTIAP